MNINYKSSLGLFILLGCAVAATQAATAVAAGNLNCESVLGQLCALNGSPGLHCHPCAANAYVICSSSGEAELKGCPAGQIFDAFLAQCKPDSWVTPSHSKCTPGTNIKVPEGFMPTEDSLKAVQAAATAAAGTPSSWWSSVAAKATAAVSSLLGGSSTTQQELESASDAAAAASKSRRALLSATTAASAASADGASPSATTPAQNKKHARPAKVAATVSSSDDDDDAAAAESDDGAAAAVDDSEQRQAINSKVQKLHAAFQEAATLRRRAAALSAQANIADSHAGKEVEAVKAQLADASDMATVVPDAERRIAAAEKSKTEADKLRAEAQELVDKSDKQAAAAAEELSTLTNSADSKELQDLVNSGRDLIQGDINALLALQQGSDAPSTDAAASVACTKDAAAAATQDAQHQDDDDYTFFDARAADTILVSAGLTESAVQLVQQLMANGAGQAIADFAAADGGMSAGMIINSDNIYGINLGASTVSSNNIFTINQLLSGKDSEDTGEGNSRSESEAAIDAALAEKEERHKKAVELVGGEGDLSQLYRVDEEVFVSEQAAAEKPEDSNSKQDTGAKDEAAKAEPSAATKALAESYHDALLASALQRTASASNDTTSGRPAPATQALANMRDSQLKQLASYFDGVYSALNEDGRAVLKQLPPREAMEPVVAAGTPVVSLRPAITKLLKSADSSRLGGLLTSQLQDLSELLVQQAQVHEDPFGAADEEDAKSEKDKRSHRHEESEESHKSGSSSRNKEHPMKAERAGPRNKQSVDEDESATTTTSTKRASSAKADIASVGIAGAAATAADSKTPHSGAAVAAAEPRKNETAAAGASEQQRQGLDNPVESVDPELLTQLDKALIQLEELGAM